MEMGRIKAGPPPRRENEDSWRCRTIIGLLQEIGETRLLTEREATLLRYAISRTTRRSVWRWSHREDSEILAFMASRKGIIYGNRRGALLAKPFQRDDAVRNLADTLGRTEWAVYRRIERLRKKQRESSNAKAKKGE